MDFASLTAVLRSGSIGSANRQPASRRHVVISHLSSSAKADDPGFRGASDESRSRGVLDTPPSRSMTTDCRPAQCVAARTASSSIQLSCRRRSPHRETHPRVGDEGARCVSPVTVPCEDLPDVSCGIKPASRGFLRRTPPSLAGYAGVKANQIFRRLHASVASPSTSQTYIVLPIDPFAIPFKIKRMMRLGRRTRSKGWKRVKWSKILNGNVC
jgi:hypothetical protein